MKIDDWDPCIVFLLFKSFLYSPIFLRFLYKIKQPTKLAYENDRLLIYV